MKRLFVSLLITGLAISLLGADGFAKEKEKENFRIKFLYQFGDTVSQSDFRTSDYSLWLAKPFEFYFGMWGGYSRNDESDYCWLGTFTELDYIAGDSVPLRQLQRVNTSKIGRSFGVEAEIRLYRDLWLGVSAIQSPVFVINSVEESEEMVFKKWETISEGELMGLPYYRYYMELKRLDIVQKTGEKFYSRNFQLYLKGENSYGFFWVFSGIGLDIWQMNRKVEKNQMIRGLMPWTAEKISEKEENSEYANSAWYLRPFTFMGIRIPIIKGLDAGVQAKFFFGNEKEFHYGHWTMKLSKNSFAFFLSLGF